MARNFNRWDLLPAANKGIKAARVSNNRAASDRYHKTSSIRNLIGGGGGKGKGGAGRTLVRLARRSNNGNIPGHGVGGVPGNGLGGGLPSAHGLLHGLLKNHHAMTNPNKGGTGITSGTVDRVNPTKIKLPAAKPPKPMAILKPPKPLSVKQPKPMTSVKLPPLGSANTTRPKFASNK